MNYPSDLKYAENHEWVRSEPDGTAIEPPVDGAVMGLRSVLSEAKDLGEPRAEGRTTKSLYSRA